ncbi:chemotaxis protein CheW [Kaarinaea lacus]
MRKSKLKDCWNKIGVWSKAAPSCEKLNEVVHCRNCDVYTQAGRLAFEKPLPKNYIQFWTQYYARENSLQADSRLSVVIFRLQQQWYAVPTRHVDVIEPRSFVHRIPNYDNQFVLGVANIKGKLQLCFSLKRLLNIATSDLGEGGSTQVGVYRRFVVLSQESFIYVFPVDEIGSVTRINSDELKPQSDYTVNNTSSLLMGSVTTEQKKVVLINTDILFTKIENAMAGQTHGQ